MFFFSQNKTILLLIRNFYNIGYSSPYWNVEQYIVFSLYMEKKLGKIGMKLFCHFVEEDKITQNKYNKKKKNRLINYIIIR